MIAAVPTAAAGFEFGSRGAAAADVGGSSIVAAAAADAVREPDQDELEALRECAPPMLPHAEPTTDGVLESTPAAAAEAEGEPAGS